MSKALNNKSISIMTEGITYLTENICQILVELSALTTSKLNGNQERLKQCKWTEGEANTDTDFSRLACECVENAWPTIRLTNAKLSTIEMTASPPDINCVFTQDGIVVKVPKNKIELKSCKGNIMPGSTIGKLDINQPLIYCRRPTNADGVYELRCGQYHTAMGESEYELFQDRTPRPSINFTRLPSTPAALAYSEKKKDDWIPHYGSCAVARISSNTVSHSWQDQLTRSIIWESIKNINTLEELDKLRGATAPR